MELRPIFARNESQPTSYAIITHADDSVTLMANGYDLISATKLELLYILLNLTGAKQIGGMDQKGTQFLHPSFLGTSRRLQSSIIAMEEKNGNWTLDECGIQTFVGKFEDLVIRLINQLARM